MITRRTVLAGFPALLGFSHLERSPMATQLDYSESRRVILDGAGAGTIQFNGPPSLTRRRLQSIDLATTPATPRPTVQLYRGTVAPGRRIGATRLGDSDTLQNDGEILASGEPLFVVFSGGAAGAAATVNVYGSDDRA